MSDKAKPQSNDDLLAGGFGLLGLALLAATMKFAPPVLAGLVLGLLIHAGAQSLYGWPKLRTQVLGFVFLAFALFVLFGAPFDLSQLRAHEQVMKYPRYSGALLYWDVFLDLIRSAIQWWNGGIGGVLRGIRIDPRKVVPLALSQYFWITLPAAVFSGLASEILGRMNPKSKTGARTTGGTGLLCWPAHAVWGGYFTVFGVWVARAIGDIIENERGPLRGAARAAGSVIIFTVIGLFVGLVIVSHIPFFEWQWISTLLCFAPAAGFALGFVVGLVQWIVGGVRGLSAPRKSANKLPPEFALGRDLHGKPYYLTSQNLAYHVEIIAPSGAGKTNLLKNLLADRIARGHGVIFLDLKGEFDVAAWMQRAAASAGRSGDVRLLSLANRELSVPYNPIKRGSAPEIHSQIMSALTWSEEFYRKIASIALMTLLRGLTEWRDKTGELFHLGHIYELLETPGALRAFNARLSSLGCPASRDIELLAEKLDRPSEREKLMGLIAGLNSLIYSAAGPLMSVDATQGSYDFKEAIDEGRVTYFLMNSLLLKESAAVFGKMILQDLMSFIGHRYAAIDRGGTPRPVTFIIDEFANFATPEFIDFMDRARGAGIGIVMAHQARADLRKISPEFQERVEANSNTVIVSGIKSGEDAEYYAGQVGTRTTEKETRQVERGFLWDNDTGMKSIREVEEYVVHPNHLKRLDQGEVFTISRTVDARWGLVRIPVAEEFYAQATSSDELKAQFKVTRASYLNGTSEKYLVLSAAPARALKPTKPAIDRIMDFEQEPSPQSPEEGEDRLPEPDEPELWS